MDKEGINPLAELQELMQHLRAHSRRHKPETVLVGKLSTEEMQEHEELTNMRDILIKKLEESQILKQQYDARGDLFWANVRTNHKLTEDYLELKGNDIFGGNRPKDPDEIDE